MRYMHNVSKYCNSCAHSQHPGHVMSMDAGGGGWPCCVWWYVGGTYVLRSGSTIVVGTTGMVPYHTTIS